MRTTKYDGQSDPLFQLGQDDGGGTWHEIASLPLTEPKVSSVVAVSRDLDQWESDWIAWHGEHSGLKLYHEYVTYGDLNDRNRTYRHETDEEGNWEKASDTEFLLRCCGQDRPLRKRGFRIKATPSKGNDVVTIRNYVSGESTNTYRHSS